ncbi:MAG: heme-binding protein [Candidatus Eremiobacteraeota bacterium]|nr:heme-binding protein [Candidatus Eremiobacteraeota bacterium]
MIDETFLTRNNAKLSAKGAHAILHAAEEEAARMGVPQCIAVVDEGGQLLAFSRMDGARIGSIEIAITKAVSAAIRRRPTADEAGGDVLITVRLALAAREQRMTGQGGGLPIEAEAQVVGGIGVSSGTSEQDTQVAHAGLAAFLGAPAGAAR